METWPGKNGAFAHASGDAGVFWSHALSSALFASCKTNKVIVQLTLETMLINGATGSNDPDSNIITVMDYRLFLGV